MQHGLNKQLRKTIARLVHSAKEGHIPSSFSIIDLLQYLYRHVLQFDKDDPSWEGRDYFILSKGHGCAALYVVLHQFGFLTDEDLAQYSQYGGRLGGHPDVTKVPGVEASTGSLGHGFPLAAGLALGLKIQEKPNRIFALLGDGECNEGTIWESALVASRQKLNNLIAMVDLNGSAAQILPVDPLIDKWKAFGWRAFEVDGHCEESLKTAFDAISQPDPQCRPSVMIAKTIKGKGVRFVEGHGKWHHKIPSLEELKMIEEELQ